MKLLLSSDAAPAASTPDLSRACRRRSLAGLELTAGAGHAHGVNSALCPPREQAGVACVASDAAPVHWLRVLCGASKAMTLTWAGGAHRLGAGLLLAAPAPNPPMGVPLALVHGTDPAAASNAARWAERRDARTCWEVTANASKADLDADLDAWHRWLFDARSWGCNTAAEKKDRAASSLTPQSALT